jgi:hypothetical protein
MDVVNRINDSLIKKDQTFYAILWKDMMSDVYLEYVDAIETKLNLYGDDVRVLYYHYQDKESPLGAVQYHIAGIDSGHSGFYSPALVRATTNADGEVVQMDYCEYYIYGYYLPPEDSFKGGLADDGKGPDEGQYPGGLDDDGKGPDEGPDGAGPDERDPAVYGENDETFLGSWTEEQLGSALAIVEASPQVGGYQLYFTFYAIGGATAVGYVDEGGGMCVYNVEASWDEGEFQAYISPKRDGGLSVFITWSDIESVPEFSTYTYYPAN